MHSHIRVGENNKPLCELHVLAFPPLYNVAYLHDLQGSWVEAISQFHDFLLCLVKDVLPHVVVVTGEVEL